jgi:hypothetical protein
MKKAGLIHGVCFYDNNDEHIETRWFKNEKKRNNFCKTVKDFEIIKKFDSNELNQEDLMRLLYWKTKETFKEWFKRMKDIDSYLINRKGNND